MRTEVLLLNYSQRSDENARRAREELFGVQNSRKAQIGRLAGLQDPAVMKAKQAAEKALRDAVGRRSAAPRRCRFGLGRGRRRPEDPPRHPQGRTTCWKRPGLPLPTSSSIARTLVRMAEEDGKPNAQRLREYRKSNRESLEQCSFPTAPIYDDLETLKLADALSMYVTEAGADNALVVKVLAGKSPRDRAAALVAGTQLNDVAVRRELAKGGKAAIAASKTP